MFTKSKLLAMLFLLVTNISLADGVYHNFDEALENKTDARCARPVP